VTASKARGCLRAATLEALARGTLPEQELEAVQRHLPACSKCLRVVAAGVDARTRARMSPVDRDAAVRERPIRYGAAHLMAVLISFLALGGSIAWWRMAGTSLGDGGLVLSITRAISTRVGAPQPTPSEPTAGSARLPGCSDRVRR
jgi:anti-sigma factor RsiW